MKCKFKAFGHPFWGKIKKRRLMPLLRRFYGKNWLDRITAYHTLFADYKVGDIINDCSSFNVVIEEIDPDYWNQVLFDIHFTTSGGGCSLIHCGLEPQAPYEDTKKRMDYILNNEEYKANYPGMFDRYKKATLTKDGRLEWNE